MAFEFDWDISIKIRGEVVEVVASTTRHISSRKNRDRLAKCMTPSFSVDDENLDVEERLDKALTATIDSIYAAEEDFLQRKETTDDE